MINVNGLRGDMVLSACLRFDAAPIPSTFEADIRLTPETAPEFADGALIRVNEIDFRIIHAAPLKNAGGNVQGKYAMSATRITAFVDGCVGVARPRRTAVVHKNTAFSAIYRECGGTASIEGDFNVGRFACLVGGIPTYALAQALQEEAAMMAWRDGKVELMRLRDVIAKTPVESMTIESSEDLRSSFLEDDEIPVYYSTDANGKFIAGQRKNPAQVVDFSPRKNARELTFMSNVLVRRKIITTSPNIAVRPADVVDIRGVPHVVMTGAHFMKNDSDGTGAAQYSRFWIGSLA